MPARRGRLVVSFLLILTGLAGLIGHAFAQGGGGVARSIELSGTIDPASAQWLGRALDNAADDGAELAIIRIDTPGGLDTSTRTMVQDIIGAPMPVVAYVSPDGARAASAGLFITQATDVAAMAPQTNIGSATPIQIGPGETDEVLGRKIENDAAAYVRALTEAHGRNGDLAVLMVREAANRTASQALVANLINIVATSEEDLLSQLDGFQVQGPKEQTLSTEGMRIERDDMPFLFQLLQIIVNPTISFMLLGVGMLGIVIEILNPGLIAPGAAGLVALLLGLYGTAQIPIRIAGVLLLLIAGTFIIAEAHLGAGGILGAVGVVALVASGLLLYDIDAEGFGVSEPVVIIVGLVVGAAMVVVAKKVVSAQRDEPVRTGWEEMVNAEGEVRIPLDPEGQIFIEGALWKARVADGAPKIAPGNRVRVESVDGLTLVVKPAGEETQSTEGS